MSEVLAVERATGSDARRIVSLLDEAANWLKTHAINQWTPGSFTDEVASAVAAGEMYVARRSEAVVGCFRLAGSDRDAAAVWQQSDQSRSHPAYLSRLAVSRSASGESLGVQLLDEAVRIAAAVGVDAVRLDCWTGNDRLRQYYLDAGFAHLGDFSAATRDRGGEVVSISLFERPTNRPS